MAIVNRIRRILAAFLQHDDTPCGRDAIAYHSPPDELQLRFSPISVLRRYHRIPGVRGGATSFASQIDVHDE